MSLRGRLLLYLLLLHAAILGLTLALFRSQVAWLVAIEVALLVSVAIAYSVLCKALLPLDFVRQFKDLLQDENYAARMKAQANRETHELASLFNRMLENLYQERLRLGEQQGFLEQLLEATPGAVIVFDFDAKVSLCNAFSKQLFGSQIVEGTTLGGATSSAFVHALAQLQVGESQVLSNEEGRRFRCQRNAFIDRGFRREFLLIDEITEELASSEKATYEKLVRVLAHEVNNTVAATGSVLESLLYYRDQLRSEDSVDFCTAIVAVQKRNMNLAAFIERFTRVVKMPEPVLRAVDVAAVMDDILFLYKPICAEQGISLGWTQKQIAPVQNLDRHLFEQAMMNVVKNAVEAVVDRRKADDLAFIQLSLHQDQHQQWQLAVIDSGKGLAQIAAENLFTPFFTTKKGGQGVGLLFVREVLHRHGLPHRLTTNADGNTQFTVDLSA